MLGQPFIEHFGNILVMVRVVQLVLALFVVLIKSFFQCGKSFKRGWVAVVKVGVVRVFLAACTQENIFVERLLSVPVAVIAVAGLLVYARIIRTPERRTADDVSTERLVLIFVRIEQRIVSENAAV